HLSDVAMTNYINPDAESDFDLKAGIHVGVFANFDFADGWQFIPEAVYTNKGVRAINRINLHYINIPMMVRLRVAEHFFAEAGPELGYLFAAKSEYGDVSSTWNNKFDFGVAGGIGLQAHEKLHFCIRYSAGFASVIDTRAGSAPAGESIKYQNRVLQISMGFLLSKLSTSGLRHR
ncbi:MAG TPA: porin family protein, partial [Chryseosolibacter sp.]|nr:porin family protein [Chryseosolibacter sp.]